MPAEFDDVFALVRAHVAEPVFAHVEEGDEPMPVTVFDWTGMEEEQQELFVEYQLSEFADAQGPGWSERFVPFALVGGDTHPVEEDEFDAQCDGVLLLDLESGDDGDCPVLFVSDPSSEAAEAFAPSLAALHFTESEDDEDEEDEDDLDEEELGDD